MPHPVPDNPSTASKLRKGYFAVFAVVATELIGFGLFIPVFPQLALDFKVSGFWMGLLVSSFSICQFIATPILGALSDRWGRKPLLVFSKIGTCLSYLFLANVTTYPLFLLARCLDGFTGGNIAVARAYLVDITPGENKAKGMAIIGLSFATGFIIGPALGGFLFNVFPSHAGVAYVCAFLSFLATLLTMVLIKEKSKDRPKQSWRVFRALPKGNTRRVILPVLGVHLCFMSLFASFEVTLSVFTNHLFSFSVSQNSHLFLLAGLLTLFIQGFYSKKPFKNLEQAVFIGILSSAIAYFILASTTSLGFLIVALALLAFGVGTMFTHLPSLLTKKIRPEITGQVMGIYDSVGSMSRFVGPLLIYSFFFTDLSDAYLFSGVSLVVVSILFSLLWKKQFFLLKTPQK